MSSGCQIVSIMSEGKVVSSGLGVVVAGGAEGTVVAAGVVWAAGAEGTVVAAGVVVAGGAEGTVVAAGVVWAAGAEGGAGSLIACHSAMAAFFASWVVS